MPNTAVKHHRIVPLDREGPPSLRPQKAVDLTYRTGRYKMPEMPTLNPFGHAKRILTIEQTIDLLQTELENTAHATTDLTLRSDRLRLETRDLGEAIRHESALRRELENEVCRYDTTFRALAQRLLLDPTQGELGPLISASVHSLIKRTEQLRQEQKACESLFSQISFPDFVGQTNEAKLEHVLDKLSLLQLENDDLRDADTAHRSVMKDLDRRKSLRRSLVRPDLRKSEDAPNIPTAAPEVLTTEAY